jgi:hypothetical protein
MTTLMQGLIQLFGHPLVYALGWTLLHFCWQGAAVALMLGCVLGLLGGRSSQARYAAACLALGLMVALPAATFAHIASAEYQARTAILGPGIVLDTGIVLNVGASEPIPPWPARIAMALDHALPWVLLAWFARMRVEGQAPAGLDARQPNPGLDTTHSLTRNGPRSIGRAQPLKKTSSF